MPLGILRCMAYISYTRSQSGATLAESSVSVLIFCLIFLGLIESAHWLLLRQALNQALFNTARIAVTQQAHPQIIHQAFEEQLQSLSSFIRPTTPTYWRIQHHSLAQANAAVRHGYQALQYTQGNLVIFDQNTLVLQLLYAHKPLTPLVRTVVAWTSAWQHTEHAALAQHGLIPIVSELQLPMQSDQTTLYAGQRKGGALNDKTTAVQLPPAPLSSLGWKATGPPMLLPWAPRADTPISEDICDGNQCCGPLF